MPINKNINPTIVKNITKSGRGVCINDVLYQNFKTIMYIKKIKDNRKEKKLKSPKKYIDCLL